MCVCVCVDAVAGMYGLFCRLLIKPQRPFLHASQAAGNRMGAKKKGGRRRVGKEGDIVGGEGKLLCNYPSLVLGGVPVSCDFLGTDRVAMECENRGAAVSSSGYQSTNCSATP